MADLAHDFALDCTKLTAEVVSAFISNNSIQASALPELLRNVHATFLSLTTGRNDSSGAERTEQLTPAQIRKSIKPDALISFEDGKSYKSLKRHLTKLGMTPNDYRQKYGLPVDYPMVSASYSAQRSELARSLGLGQRRRKANQTPATASEKPGAEESSPAHEKSKRAGRPRKATAA